MAGTQQESVSTPIFNNDYKTEIMEDDEPIDESEISSAGHAELEQHRELRKMVRLAAWEMPLLSEFSVPFVVPNKHQYPLRWRYTTYFGDSHPASRKVVVDFRVQDLRLSKEQSLKLKKLAGVRYNPATDTVKMSNESFETQAQNKRYLGDIIRSLINEAKDKKADSFKDVPLDLRHYKPKPNFRFPKEWKMTPKRRAELQKRRKAAELSEARRVEQGVIVSGEAAIEANIQQDLLKIEQPVMAEARRPLPSGKQGRREMARTVPR